MVCGARGCSQVDNVNIVTFVTGGPNIETTKGHSGYHLQIPYTIPLHAYLLRITKLMSLRIEPLVTSTRKTRKSR